MQTFYIVDNFKIFYFVDNFQTFYIVDNFKIFYFVDNFQTFYIVNNFKIFNFVNNFKIFNFVDNFKIFNFVDNFYAWLTVFVLPINSALNPIIYSITTPSFRIKFRNQFCCKMKIPEVFTFGHISEKFNSKSDVIYPTCPNYFQIHHSTFCEPHPTGCDMQRYVRAIGHMLSGQYPKMLHLCHQKNEPIFQTFLPVRRLLRKCRPIYVAFYVVCLPKADTEVSHLSNISLSTTHFG